MDLCICAGVHVHKQFRSGSATEPIEIMMYAQACTRVFVYVYITR